MTLLYTCSYRAYRPEFGQPVVTSLGLPKWIPEAEQWPRCWLITPTSALFHGPGGAEFAAGYEERLNKFGPALVARTLEKIARQYDAEALVLLCFEQRAADCHRGQFASWLFDTTGELAPEVLTGVVPDHDDS
jgi:uncharacterized protein DUF488